MPIAIKSAMKGKNCSGDRHFSAIHYDLHFVTALKSAYIRAVGIVGYANALGPHQAHKITRLRYENMYFEC